MLSGDSHPGGTENRKMCVGCREPIHSQARICPHCHTPQFPKRWRSIGEVLKWLGGITAVFSLVVGVVQLSEVLKTMRERTQAVDELVRAADVQIDVADYPGALRLIEQALELEPASRQARKRHLEIAMKWVRKFDGLEHQKTREFSREDYTRIIDPLVPILHGGVAGGNPSKVADVLAHIGWANHLRLIGGTKDLNPIEYFQRALVKDPANAFAHAMWATMCATEHQRPGCGDDNLETARAHYVAALKSGQQRKYVENIRLTTLLNIYDKSAIVQIIDLVQEMKDSGTTVSMEYKYDALSRIASLYMDLERFYRAATDRQVGDVPLSDALSAAEWLFEGLDYEKLKFPQAKGKHRLLVARLHELAGNAHKAIEKYRSIRLDIKARRINRAGMYPFRIQTDIDKSMLQLLKIRRGALGVRLQGVDEKLAQSLGLKEAKGALVEEVTAGGGADKAGIKVGDVILEVNGVRYEEHLLRRLFGLALAGDLVEVVVFRDGQHQALKVALGERAEADDEHYDFHLLEHYNVAFLVDRALYGAVHVRLDKGNVWLADLTDELREAFEVEPGIGGVVVLEQEDIQLRQGELITQVEQTEVRSAARVAELIKHARSSGQPSIRITLIENGKRNTVAFSLVSGQTANEDIIKK